MAWRWATSTSAWASGSVLPLAALGAAVAGAILGFPVLRMHGDYLAIVTLGFGEIIRLVLNNWLSFTGGPNGMPAPAPTFLGLEFGRRAKDGGVADPRVPRHCLQPQHEVPVHLRGAVPGRACWCSTSSTG
ncbi:branched chain amino acid ABC transporter permease [Pseudomonas aeruginosa]|nr:branched chain amino acid ABC transporter permease [Pseudomonas aeruginosa]